MSGNHLTRRSRDLRIRASVELSENIFTLILNLTNSHAPYTQFSGKVHCGLKLAVFLISLLKSSISPAQAGNIISEFPKEKFVKKFAKKNSFAIDTNLKIL